MAHFYVSFSITSLNNLPTPNFQQCSRGPCHRGLEAQTKVLDVAAKAMSAIVQAILTNIPTGSHPGALEQPSQGAVMEVGTSCNSLSDLSILPSPCNSTHSWMKG